MSRSGGARTLFVFSNEGLGFKPSSLGLPETIDWVVDRLMFPHPRGGADSGTLSRLFQHHVFEMLVSERPLSKEARARPVAG